MVHVTGFAVICLSKKFGPTMKVTLKSHQTVAAKSIMEFVGNDVGGCQAKYGNRACKLSLPDESKPLRLTKYFMDIYPEGQLVQETTTKKLVDYPDHLLRTLALTAVYRESSVRRFE
ncbi:hypothetical protein TNCV_3120781 [Trichonephila clavipes]|uniref:Uncharacterized protein n=1 Tax=Trichonephila clavipes TaxID=2585209 RepID=A0A8X7BH33_TRICX|nr:hypothetical protein TNCV_3120781 [Trichonephila clavipes]